MVPVAGSVIVNSVIPITGIVVCEALTANVHAPPPAWMVTLSPARNLSACAELTMILAAPAAPLTRVVEMAYAGPYALMVIVGELLSVGVANVAGTDAAAAFLRRNTDSRAEDVSAHDFGYQVKTRKGSHIRVRVDIIGHARIKYVCKSQSCMV